MYKRYLRKKLKESLKDTTKNDIDSEIEYIVRNLEVSFKGKFIENEIGAAYYVNFTGEDSAEAVEAVEEHFYEINVPGIEYMNVRGVSIEFILDDSYQSSEKSSRRSVKLGHKRINESYNNVEDKVDEFINGCNKLYKSIDNSQVIPLKRELLSNLRLVKKALETLKKTASESDSIEID